METSAKEKHMLGILGGMGPEATSVLYKRITDRTVVSCDQEHIDILIYSHAGLPDRTGCILCGEGEQLWEKLSKDDQKRTEYIYVAECEEITPPEDWDGASDIDGCPNIIDGETVYKIIDSRIIKSAFIDAYQILPDSEKRRFPGPESHSVDIK